MVGLCGMPATGVVVLMMGKVGKIELRVRWQWWECVGLKEWPATDEDSCCELKKDENERQSLSRVTRMLSRMGSTAAHLYRASYPSSMATLNCVPILVKSWPMRQSTTWTRVEVGMVCLGRKGGWTTVNASGYAHWRRCHQRLMLICLPGIGCSLAVCASLRLRASA